MHIYLIISAFSLFFYRRYWNAFGHRLCDQRRLVAVQVYAELPRAVTAPKSCTMYWELSVLPLATTIPCLRKLPKTFSASISSLFQSEVSIVDSPESHCFSFVYAVDGWCEILREFIFFACVRLLIVDKFLSSIIPCWFRVWNGLVCKQTGLR